MPLQPPLRTLKAQRSLSHDAVHLHCFHSNVDHDHSTSPHDAKVELSDPSNLLSTEANGDSCDCDPEIYIKASNAHDGVVSLSLNWLQLQQERCHKDVTGHQLRASHLKPRVTSPQGGKLLCGCTPRHNLTKIDESEAMGHICQEEEGDEEIVETSNPHLGNAITASSKSAPRSSGYNSHTDSHTGNSSVRFEIGSPDDSTGLTPPTFIENNRAMSHFSRLLSTSDPGDEEPPLTSWQHEKSSAFYVGQSDIETVAQLNSWQFADDLPVSPLNVSQPRRASEVCSNRNPAWFSSATTFSSMSPETRKSTQNLPLSRKDRRLSLAEQGFGQLESYDKLDKLGEGTYASVFKARSHLTDSLVALKEIRLEQKEGAPCTAIREISILRDLRHANVVTLHDIVHTSHAITLVFEYVERDLRQYMDACDGFLHVDNARLFLYQLLRGLEYIHRRRILHRDLKPQNLLVSARGDLKLADFGLARVKSIPNAHLSHEVVTLWYRPPDVLLGCTDYSTNIDMWSVGCILFEMLAGRPCFPGASLKEELSVIFKCLGSPPERVWQECQGGNFQRSDFPHYSRQSLLQLVPRLSMEGHELLEKCLEYVGSQRISAKQSLSHPYFVEHLPVSQLAALADSSSVFQVPGVSLQPDPGARCHQPATSGLQRRPCHFQIAGGRLVSCATEEGLVTSRGAAPLALQEEAGLADIELLDVAQTKSDDAIEGNLLKLPRMRRQSMLF